MERQFLTLSGAGLRRHGRGRETKARPLPSRVVVSVLVSCLFAVLPNARGADCFVPLPPTAGVFNDVPSNHWAHDFIQAVALNGIMTACGDDYVFCPNDVVTREGMAVILERAEHGSGFGPPPAAGIFADVPTSSCRACWIESLFADGITAGCGLNPLRYCPDDPVTRAQMAVFLLRLEHGPGYTPPPCVDPTFEDVPCWFWAADWIEQFHAEGLTAGCSSNPPLYCPEAAVSRAEMAVFLSRLLGLLQ